MFNLQNCKSILWNEDLNTLFFSLYLLYFNKLVKILVYSILINLFRSFLINLLAI